MCVRNYIQRRKKKYISFNQESSSKVYPQRPLGVRDALISSYHVMSYLGVVVIQRVYSYIGLVIFFIVIIVRHDLLQTTTVSSLYDTYIHDRERKPERARKKEIDKERVREAESQRDRE